MRSSLKTTRRMVVKVGTRVVAREDGRLALGRLGMLVEQIAELRERGIQVLLVTSGAIGLGAERLKIRPKSVADKQACAAAGQGALMSLYDVLARRLGVPTAQVLLVESDFHDRPRYVALADSLERLLELGALPIINENDAVSTAGLVEDRAGVFGDNDRLAALVAAGLDADLLVLLTNVDGLLTGPPDEAGSERIPVWDGQDVRFGAASHGGRGGMQAKVTSAQVAALGGSHVVVANGFSPGVLERVVAGDDVGTWFPRRGGQSRQRNWLRFATSPTAAVVVNTGARQALLERNASLLPVGVTRVDGEFSVGDVIAIRDENGSAIARGVAKATSTDARASAGQRDRGTLVHRNQIVFLEDL
ncbi:MAG: glutamate 5-kinase [Proteobacteria bacterium]|nr:glutamate 5-kinase [Pseudomonadota bacterium]MCP4918820.1 glutamate 5-kinase [Pseudomonadota bacterium]